MAGAKIVGDPVTLDAEHAKPASCQLRRDRAPHPPETDDDDIASLGRSATAGHGTISAASSEDLAWVDPERRAVEFVVTEIIGAPPCRRGKASSPGHLIVAQSSLRV
jgi:hypothetical protein